MINQAKTLVAEIMKKDNSGHGMDHINRVLSLAIKFAEHENCNKEWVALGALLHDVDDYKLFGSKNQAELTNANIILNKIKASEDTKQAVLDIVAKVGFSKRQKGICPNSIEGKIVSDADMCDALGASGILRTFQYSISNNQEFFNKEIWPMESFDINKYTSNCAVGVCHIFDKILKLKGLMLTDSGKREAGSRHDFVISFLRQYFIEEQADDWINYLNKYLKNQE